MVLCVCAHKITERENSHKCIQYLYAIIVLLLLFYNNLNSIFIVVAFAWNEHKNEYQMQIIFFIQNYLKLKFSHAKRQEKIFDKVWKDICFWLHTRARKFVIQKKKVSCCICFFIREKNPFFLLLSSIPNFLCVKLDAILYLKCDGVYKFDRAYHLYI